MGTAYRLGSLLAAGLLALSGCAGASDFRGPRQPESGGVHQSGVAQQLPGPDDRPRRGGDYWAVATNGNGSNVQDLRSTDLMSWEQGPDALPELPEWT